jgi:hypothetical protein
MRLEMERQELYSLLSEAMRGAIDQLGDWPLVRAGKVKSRLIEAHPPEASVDGARALLAEVAEQAGGNVSLLGDDLLVLATRDDAFFVDTLNPRFWLLYTTATAARLASLMRKQLLSRPAFDTAWFPAAQLDELEGERQWIKSSFVADDLNRGSQDGVQASPRRWRVQVEGVEPQELLEVVRERLPRYAAATALTAVGSLVSAPDNITGRAFVIADYRGSFVSSGDSFETVAGVLWRFVDRYEQYVRQLEGLYRLRTTNIDSVGLALDGEVAVIDLPRQIEDVPTFAASLFDCRDPFRLWAVPKEVAPGEWEANAVDLHIGQPLRLEITHQWIRVLLNDQTCGNTLARLIANLQHRFHAQTDIAQVAV